MEEKKSNGFAIAALVLGIVSIVFSFIGLSWLGLIIGTVFCALIFIACVACIGAVGTAGGIASSLY